MRYARDRAGRLVEAQRAKKGRTYWCPGCGAPCHLRMGPEREPHFAHNPGYGSTDCQYYYPGSGTSQHGETVPLRTKAPDLYVWCSNDSSNDMWRLFLRIPPVPNAMERVVIEAGERGVVSVVLRRNKKSYRVFVRPQETPYELRFIGRDSSGHTESVRARVEGLKITDYNVFRYSRLGGRRLEDERPLCWGREYVLVWRDDYIQPRWPRELARREMEPNGRWHGSIIGLPAVGNSDVKRWVKNVLGRDVVDPAAKLTLVWPIPISWIDNATVVVPEDSEIIVGVIGLGNALGPSRVAVQYAGKTDVYAVPVDGRLPVLISLGRLKRGWTEVWLPDQPEVQLSLLAAPLRVTNVEFPSVVFRFADPQDDGELRVPLFSTQLADRLLDVRSGRLRLASVELPERATGYLRFRHDKEIRWQETQVTVDTEADMLKSKEELEAIVAQEIRKCVLRKDGILEIDFGSFGRVSARLSGIRAKSEGAVLPLPLRRRVDWLLSLGPTMASHGQADVIFRVAVASCIENFGARDRVVLRKLATRWTWPSVLQPHLRGLAKMIRRLCDTTAGQGKRQQR